jgi:hypothetical protein
MALGILLSRRVWRSSTAHLTWLSQKKTVDDGKKLLTYLNSALKVLSGLDIFPRGTKKKLNFVDQRNQCIMFVCYTQSSYARYEH